MRKLIVGLCLGLMASAASADGVQNKWRLEVSGNAESAGRIVLQLAPAEGDPIFVTEPDEKVGRQIHVARPGFHNHFPIWSHDGRFIYFVHGLPLDKSDIWRIPPTGGIPERLTFHDARVTFPTLLNDRTLLYLTTDEDGFGPWIYAAGVLRSAQ